MYLPRIVKAIERRILQNTVTEAGKCMSGTRGNIAEVLTWERKGETVLYVNDGAHSIMGGIFCVPGSLRTLSHFSVLSD